MERPAEVGFANVDLVLKPGWMPKLIDRIDLTANASVDHFTHPVNAD